MSEDVLELGRQGASGVFLDSLTGLHVKLAGRVPDGGFLLGGLIAFSLDGVDVEEFGISDGTIKLVKEESVQTASTEKK